MKTAISIPDPIFQKAERLARRMKKSRSQLYSEAVTDYLDRHSEQAMTEAMNRVCDAVGDTTDPFVSQVARRVLEQTEW